MDTSIQFFACLGAYLLGSIPTAMIISKKLSLSNPTETGSNNPGATNMLRIGGKKVALLTLIIDLTKGLLAMLLATAFLGMQADPRSIVMLFVVIGHIWPIFNRFRGGKGVATLIGALLVFNIYIALFLVLAWLIIAKLFKISSLSAVIAITLTPIFSYFHDLPSTALVVLTICCILVVARHYKNIRRLLLDTEKSIKF